MDEMRWTVYGPFSAEFQEDSLRDLCVDDRGIQTGPFGSQLHQRDYVSIGTPIITVEHLGENQITHDDVPKVSDSDRNRLKRYELRQGDIVFSRVGSVDRRALVSKAEEGWLFSGRCLRVRANSDKIDPTYLSYFFGLETFKEYIRSIAFGATMPSLNTRLLSDVSVVYPPLPEQRAIAHILGTLDDKIELNRRMNETLEEMARALFKSWFVDFEPVRAKMEGRWRRGESLPGMPAELYELFPGGMVDSELGEIPAGWEVKGLDEIADFRNGLALQRFRPGDNDDRLPVVKIAQLRSGRADSGEWAKASIDPSCVLDDGDIVFSWSGSLLIKVWCGGRAALNQHLFKVTSEQYPKWFFLNCIQTHLSEFQRIAADKATTMGHIRRHHLSAAKCVGPDQALISAADDTFARLLLKRISIHIESRSLDALRDTLLPKLISGEMRLKQTEQLLSGVK